MSDPVTRDVAAAPGGAPVAVGRELFDDVEGRALVLRARRLREEGRLTRRALVALAVVAVIVVVAQSMVSGFVRFGCRAKQAEAKMALRALYVAEEAYRGELDRYSEDFEALGYRPTPVRYTVVVSAVPTSQTDVPRFRAWAFADPRKSGSVDGDLWTITNADAKPVHVNDGCRVR